VPIVCMRVVVQIGRPPLDSPRASHRAVRFPSFSTRCVPSSKIWPIAVAVLCTSSVLAAQTALAGPRCIHDLVKGLRVAKAIVVGHDIGLMVAYAHAAKYPAETGNWY
jgi:pimeloyl-ACP methyl ester carboxylesterase